MKWGWDWTMGSSAFQRYHPSNLIQPSSPSYFVLLQIRGLSTDLFWLLSLILGWKARQLTRCGQAIKFWVCAPRCVCAGETTWLRMGCFLASAAEGRLDGQEGEERAQEWDDGVLLGRKNWWDVCSKT